MPALRDSLLFPAGPDRLLPCTSIKPAPWRPRPRSRLRTRWWNWMVTRYGTFPPFIVLDTPAFGRITSSVSWLRVVHFRLVRHRTRGKTGFRNPFMCQSTRVRTLRNVIASLDHSLTGDLRAFIDDPYYLARNQGKGKPRNFAPRPSWSRPCMIFPLVQLADRMRSHASQLDRSTRLDRG